MTARRIDGATATRDQLLRGWELCSTQPDSCPTPLELAASPREWISAAVPGTAAGALQAAGIWSLDGPEIRFDAYDWWYRIRFDVAPEAPRQDALLDFDGLATHCEAWLNGDPLLQSDSMFVAHSVPARNLLPGTNELLLVFRALDAALKKRRPRPRWRAPMIENQQLRWHRTTVLGRTPGWSPPAAPVGPWKPVWLRMQAEAVEAIQICTRMEDGAGVVEFSARSRNTRSFAPTALQLRHDGATLATAQVTDTNGHLQGTLRGSQVVQWWPHTHGTPNLYELALQGIAANGDAVEIDLGPIGFRTIEQHSGPEGRYALSVNGVEVFCRGACWTPLDAVTLQSDPAALRHALRQTVEAGFNMLRISGAFVYEDEAFYSLCDEMGILVWQDFMFANMDYPETDEQFMTLVQQEVAQHLRRWARHPCVAVICGNSEVSQQAAMWGAPRELWSPSLFDDTLRHLSAEHCTGTPYWPSSAFGGDFPHQVNAGTCSYYGTGAYLRDPTDARRSGLRFATECLGFANVPEADTLDAMPGGGAIRVHHAIWKRRAPRDLGAGWDFDDVRDHYLRQRFSVDPLQLRYADHARYLSLSRRVAGEVMQEAFSEWRRPLSGCGGALVWFLRDLWPGAGWGIIDSRGVPKGAYYALQAVLQPRWIGITDEGLNGIAVHVGNDSPQHISIQLVLALYRDGQHLVTSAESSLNLPPHSSHSITAASLLGEFHDLTHAYRFGPPSCDLIIATMTNRSDGSQQQAFFLPNPNLHASPHPGCTLTAKAVPTAAGEFRLHVKSRGFARSVHIDAPGYAPAIQYFHMAPGAELTLPLRARAAPGPALLGTVASLNCAAPARIELAG